MRNILFLIAVFLSSNIILGQSDSKPNTDEEDEMYIIVDQMPTFPGCEDLSGPELQSCTQNKIWTFIAQNIQYPPEAKKANVQGKVYVRFVVNKFGNIQDIEILKGIGYGCEEEVKRVVNRLPIFKPAMHNGKAAMVQYNLPINFALKGKEKKKLFKNK